MKSATKDPFRAAFGVQLSAVTCPPECIHSDGESSALMADG